MQPTTPLSLFLNTTETSATPVQRSVTPLLFPEHRLQSPVTPGWWWKVKMTPELISLWVVWHLFHRAPQKQWQIPLIKSPSSLSVKYSIRLDLDLYHPLSTSSRNYSCCWNLFTWKAHQLMKITTQHCWCWYGWWCHNFAAQCKAFATGVPTHHIWQNLQTVRLRVQSTTICQYLCFSSRWDLQVVAPCRSCTVAIGAQNLDLGLGMRPSMHIITSTGISEEIE